VGDAGVVRPHLAAPEGADVENMVVGQLNDAAMTDGDDGFVSVALDHKFFDWSKGNLGLAEFIAQCGEAEIPEWIRNTCKELRALCQPPPPEGVEPAEPNQPVPDDGGDLV